MPSEPGNSRDCEGFDPWDRRIHLETPLRIKASGWDESNVKKQELTPSFAYFEEEFYQTLHASRGFHDPCIVFFPVNEDYESMFNFQRVGVARDFTAAEEAIAAYALRGIKWFHRQFALSHGLLIAESPLSPTQREITRHLLTDRSEKQIADAVGKPLAATHKYITEIFRKFGVNSRAGLMAVWLGQKA